jgi:hypothetical protein
MFELSLEEHKELDERPIGFVVKYTPEQFKLRQQIGVKVTQATYEDAKLYMTEEQATTYLQYPPHLFYLDKESNSCRRIYGIAFQTDGTCVAHAVTAMIAINNDVVGGVPFDNMEMVTEWPKDKETFLRSGLVSCAGAFLDPLGFMLFSR